MNHLHKELAPITKDAWQQIESEAASALKTTLAARKMIDVHGPLGWNASSLDLGRTKQTKKTLIGGVSAHVREVQPLLEIRVPFELDRSEINAVARGARDPDLSAVVGAARRGALAEDTGIFYGYAGIPGLVESAKGQLQIPEEDEALPELVTEAISLLRSQGIEGPYGLALDPHWFETVSRATHSGGSLVIDHIRTLIDGPLVWAPALSGAMVLSLRGGDFALTLGSDFAVGYLDHDAASVSLYLEETLAWLVNAPEAVVSLLPAQGHADTMDLKAYLSGEALQKNPVPVE